MCYNILNYYILNPFGGFYLKVLFITSIPQPYRVDFFNELGKSCDLTVLFSDRFFSERDKSWQNFSFRTFKGIFLKGTRLNSNKKSLCPEVVDYLKPGKFDRIVISEPMSPTGFLASKTMQRKKIPFWIEGDGAFTGNTEDIKAKLKSSILKGADLYLSTCENLDKYFVDYGAEPSKIRRYPFSSIFDSDVLQDVPSVEEKAALRDLLRIEEQKVVLSVGSLIPRKGPDLLIRAAAKFPKEVGFYLIGGDAPEKLVTIKDRLGATNVHFIPFSGKEKLKQYYMAADLFCFPTREDIWGLVINEAMGYGLPVITTDRCNAGIEMVKDDVNGYIIPVESVNDIVQKSAIILSDEDIQVRMGRESIKTAHRFTVESMSLSHMELFEKEK